MAHVECPLIEFHLQTQSGVLPYLQIVQQVKQALRLDILHVGDQLPTVREVVEKLVINPNTVLKTQCSKPIASLSEKG
jgi:GntR family transcriptional regulator